MKQTEIKIPKGCKATMYQDEDKIVIEYEELPKFKRGDFLTATSLWGGIWTIIFDEEIFDYVKKYKYFFMLTYNGQTIYKYQCNPDGFRISTDTERQQLLDALHAVGKDWDSEKMEIIDYAWRPKYGEPYYTPDVYEEDLYSEGRYYGADDDLLVFNRGLGCKTEEEAIERAKQMLGIK